MNRTPSATRGSRALRSAALRWACSSASAFALASACRARTFNSGTEGAGDNRGADDSRSAATWIACRSGQAWALEFDAETQALLVSSAGKRVFRGEVRAQVDRALPVARVHEAYGLRDAARYSRQEITTDHGNVTIDRVVDDGEPLERVLLLAFRVEGDGIQRTIECDTASRIDFAGTKPAGLEKGRFSSLGPDAFAKAPRWSPLTKPARAVVDGHEEVAACETDGAGAAPTRWVAMTRDDDLVVGRASAETGASSLAGYLAEVAVRGKVTKKVEDGAERDVEGARYFVSGVTWKLERGDDVRLESFTERKAGGEGLFRGSVWTVAGKSLRCAGQLGLFPPGG